MVVVGTCNDREEEEMRMVAGETGNDREEEETGMVAAESCNDKEEEVKGMVVVENCTDKMGVEEVETCRSRSLPEQKAAVPRRASKAMP